MTNLLPQIPPRKKVVFLSPDENITDQESASDFTMSSIKQKLEKHLPVTNLTSDVFYSDKPLHFRNLQDAVDFNDKVRADFEALPVEIRKAMGHDVRNFDQFVHDPKNIDLLVKYDLAFRPDAKNSDIVKSLNDLKDTLNPSPDDQKPAKN